MLKHISCLLLALSFAGTAFATFEIKDPAAEMMEEQNKTVSDVLAEKSCVQFLRDGADDSRDFWSIVSAVNKAMPDPQTAVSTETALKSWCIDHPGQNLLQAAESLNAKF